MARFHMKKFGLVLKDAESMKNYRDNWEATFGKKTAPLEDAHKLPPGSPEAVEAGCTCPVTDNHHGKGYQGVEGMHCISGDCELHNG